VFLKKTTGVSAALSLGQIVVERFLDALIVLLMLCISVLSLDLARTHAIQRAFIASAVIVTLLLILLVVHNRFPSLLDTLVSRISPKSPRQPKLLQYVVSLLQASKNVELKRVGISAFTTVCSSLCSVGAYYFFLNSVRIPASIMGVFLVYPVISLSTAVPVAFGNIGIYHAALIFALGLIGYQSGSILSQVTLVHMMLNLPPLAFGGIILLSAWRVFSRS
jgi:uncharacterized protein (TIRG00374 family)